MEKRPGSHTPALIRLNHLERNLEWNENMSIKHMQSMERMIGKGCSEASIKARLPASLATAASLSG